MNQIQSKRIAVLNGSLIYLQRGFPNLFRYFVREIKLSDICGARPGKRFFHKRLQIEKNNGDRLSLRTAGREEAETIAEMIRKKDSENNGRGESTTPSGFLLDIGKALEQITTQTDDCVSSIVDLLIEKAVQFKASDIHLEPLEKLKARYRIDGVLIDVAEVPLSYHARIASRIKVLAKLPTYQKDVPLDGRIEKSYGPGIDLRVSTFPTIRGDNVVIRLFDSQSYLLGLDELGFNQNILQQFKSLILAPEGTIMLTGPSNSGKTTTIYSALEKIHEVKRNTVNIVTIEDPVERDLKKFNQTQIAPARGLTFDSALRAVLRQDPNVIVVGEIRDRETANIAIRAGMTGHLVITTIHSGTAAGALARLVEMGLEPFAVASSVSGIMAQRLVRKVCPHCATSVKPAADFAEHFGLERAIGEEKVGTGCPKCAGAGYHGRTAIAELLLMNDALRQGALNRAPASELKKIALTSGMTDLLQDGLRKVEAGVTNAAELARVLVPNEA